MTTNRSQRSTAVITVACPWCGAPAQVGATRLHCPECAVTVEIAAEAAEAAEVALAA